MDVKTLTTAQLETARTNYAEVIAVWAAKGTESTLTRYVAVCARAVNAELKERAL